MDAARQAPSSPLARHSPSFHSPATIVIAISI
jgi:hypothetical protein